ncbi:MAG: hypothetical protein K1Y02_01960 [Candidatus Hydrogenedentes bacterium]|nr:hypothetical protein [Candidatus Hydrogenedentota bacterium]
MLTQRQRVSGPSGTGNDGGVTRSIGTAYESARWGTGQFADGAAYRGPYDRGK